MTLYSRFEVLHTAIIGQECCLDIKRVVKFFSQALSLLMCIVPFESNVFDFLILSNTESANFQAIRFVTIAV